MNIEFNQWNAGFTKWSNFILQFLGNTPVDQAKGIETVKDAIRRLQFSQQMKKAESGSNVKTKKVEITISVDGVAIQVCIEIFAKFYAQ